jgi:hypothetical protein
MIKFLKLKKIFQDLKIRLQILKLKKIKIDLPGFKKYKLYYYIGSGVIVLLIIGLIIFSFTPRDHIDEFFSKTSGFTNSGDQEFMLLYSAFEKENYTMIIDFTKKYFKDHKLDKDNLKLLVLKIDSMEKYCRQLKRQKDKSRWKSARKYGLINAKGQIEYQYKDAKSLWETFPNSKFGKKAFFNYIKYIYKPKEKINSYEEFADKLKDKSLLNQIRFELSNLYLSELNDLKGKALDKLYALYTKLMKTEYKRKVLTNFYLLKFMQNQNRQSYENDIKGQLSNTDMNGIMANYLMGELKFMDKNHHEAKSYFMKTKKMLKKMNPSESIPVIACRMENFPEENLKILVKTVNRKITLINKIAEYRNNFNNKKVAIVSGERVRIRKNPVINLKNIITTLSFGDKVRIIKKSAEQDTLENENNFWYYVELNDKSQGWVFGKYLQFFIY